MSSVFVTGTDTGVGKTLVALTLMHALRKRDSKVAGMKPVAAGTIPGTNQPQNNDAVALKQAGNVELPYETVNPFCFAQAIAPHIAAEDENMPIDVVLIKNAYSNICAQSDHVVVEGAGGWLVPISDTNSMADLVLALELPVVLVVGLRLGCLNHALLTVESIRNKGVALLGWVGSHLSADFYKAEQNIATLRSRLLAPCLGILPYQENADPENMLAYLDGLPFE